MRMKSYFAEAVEAAMSLARAELGPDAMLVDSRPAPPEARHLGEYEVIFALAPEPAAAVTRPGAQPTPALEAAAPWDRLSREITDLRRQVERTAAALARSAGFVAGGPFTAPEEAALFSTLTAAELDTELAREVIAQARTGFDPDASLETTVRAELARRFRTDSHLGSPGPRAVALVGPPGSGKTTTLVKLAVVCGLRGNRPLHILSADTYRVAAADQLSSYAAILGVGFQTVETPAGLVMALQEHRNKELVLIDTPGFGPADLPAAADLAAVLSTHPDVETILVLSASMKSVDLTRAVDRFEQFRPARLLFTRMDETTQYGPVINEAARTGKPVSFLASGQLVPEDLVPASTKAILDLVMEGRMADLRIDGTGPAGVPQSGMATAA